VFEKERARQLLKAPRPLICLKKLAAILTFLVQESRSLKTVATEVHLIVLIPFFIAAQKAIPVILFVCAQAGEKREEAVDTTAVKV